MSERRMMAAAGLVGAGLAGVAAVALGRLPAGTRLPTHWNAAGEADRFAGAATALFMPVAVAVGTSILFIVVARVEPMQDRLDRSRALLDTAWATLLALSVLIEAMVAAPAFGWHLPATLPLIGVGAMLIVIGNALPKSRPGFFVGIRTPWSILDADNWVATHRLGAWTFIAGGIGTVAAGLLPLAADTRATLVGVSLAVAVVPPIVWSWWLWRRRPSASPLPAERDRRR